MDRAADSTALEEIPIDPDHQLERLIGNQGFVTEAEYLAFDGNRLIEYSDGWIEVLPMPTTSHQLILVYLMDALKFHLTPGRLGLVLFAGIRVRLRTGKFREPDVVVMLTEHAHRVGEDYWDGADLVVEVVSPGNRRHDLDLKRREYAEAGIPEYWLVDPQQREIVVLTLRDGVYQEHGRFQPGDLATSPPARLPGRRGRRPRRSTPAPRCRALNGSPLFSGSPRSGFRSGAAAGPGPPVSFRSRFICLYFIRPSSIPTWRCTWSTSSSSSMAGFTGPPPPPTRSTPSASSACLRRAVPAWLALIAVVTAAWGLVMDGLTDAALPYLDALIAAASLVAQYLMARKVLESWWFWIAVDVLAIGVYSARGLYPTAGLYAVFLVMCLRGLVEWRRALDSSKLRPATAAPRLG